MKKLFKLTGDRIIIIGLVLLFVCTVSVVWIGVVEQKNYIAQIKINKLILDQ